MTKKIIGLAFGRFANEEVLKGFDSKKERADFIDDLKNGNTKYGYGCWHKTFSDSDKKRVEMLKNIS